MLSFENGSFRIPKTGFGNGVLSFEFEDEVISTESAAWIPRGDSWETELSNGLLVQFQIDGDVLHASFRNGPRDGFLKKIHLDFAAGPMAEDYREYTHSRLFLEQTSGVKPVGRSTPFFEHNPPSYMVYLLAARNGEKNLLLAALPPHQGDFLVFQARHESKSLNGKFGLSIAVEEDRDLKPGMAFRLSPILFRVSGKNPLELLEELGDDYAALRTAPLKERAVGWNSWDQFHADISASDVLETQKRLDAFSEHKVRYYVVDDGWQIAYGAWTPNLKFPADLAEFCRKITAEGGIPGIWTAPLCVDNHYMFPHEWIVSTADGRFALDITRPEAAQYLHSVYRRLHAAGFRYFKVDFTNRILDVPRCHDMSMGRAGILRRTYEIIRSAIGPDSYFLGCCVPYEAAFGIVDAVRTTADIQIYWSAVQINMTSASARWWMHHRLWNNDSDFLVVRGEETSDAEFPNQSPFVTGRYASGPVLSKREAESLALALHMTGGDLLFSDNFLKLNDAGRKILKDVLALAPLNEAARPLDLFSAPAGKMPSLWFAPAAGKAAVFNWGGRTRAIYTETGAFRRTPSRQFLLESEGGGTRRGWLPVPRPRPARGNRNRDPLANDRAHVLTTGRAEGLASDLTCRRAWT